MMFLASELNTAGAGVAALLGYAVVFLGLIALMLVVIAVGKFFQARSNKKVAAPVEEEEDDAFTGFAPVAAPAPAAAPAASTGFTGHVVSSASHSGRQEVVLFRPVNFNDASKAADDLRSRKVVVVNLENVDKAMARRVVDFLSGCAYSLDGSVKKIAQAAYLFCPSNLVVNGDLESLQAEVDSYV